MPVGALVGALLSGLLSDFVGRKMTVIVGASLCAFGGALQTSSFFLWSDHSNYRLCCYKWHLFVCLYNLLQ